MENTHDAFLDFREQEERLYAGGVQAVRWTAKDWQDFQSLSLEIETGDSNLVKRTLRRVIVRGILLVAEAHLSADWNNVTSREARLILVRNRLAQLS